VRRIPQVQLREGLARVSSAVGSHDKGRALEDLICFLFPLVPGIEIAERNALNAFATEEVDVALWNARSAEGLYFLPHLLLVEAKNWSTPCGSQEVSYFVGRLRQRGCDHGILFAAAGVTGVPSDLTRAHFEIAAALAAGVRVMIVTPEDIESATNTNQIVALLKRKLCQLVVSGTNFV
jgi:restriction endonuclease